METDRKERQRLAQKKLRDKRKANRLCVSCGSALNEEDGTRCETCKIKHRKNYKYDPNDKEKYIRYRQKKIENRVCVTCMKKLPEDRKSTICEECQQKQNELQRLDYKFYQEQGICPRCRKNILFGNEKSCLECRAIAANNMAKYYQSVDKEEYLARRKERSAKLLEYRRENGLCTRCGSEKSDNKFAYCNSCRIKVNLKGNEYRIRKRKKPNREIWSENGLCVKCGSERYKDYKICKTCYENMWEVSHCEAANEARKMLRF